MSISVKVYTRTRPFNKREKGLGNCVEAFDITEQVIKMTTPQGKPRTWAYDYNFGPSAQQDDVFKVIGVRVCDDFMEGFNATQFVYGQTGAGKSWTMMGNAEHRGIIPRTGGYMFEKIANKDAGWEFEIYASYLEVYMERVNDLLEPDNQNMDIKQDPKLGVYVPGLTKEAIASLDDIQDVIRRGDQLRKVAATKMNPGSSRSHSVLVIELTQTNPQGVKTQSKMNLVDLAGSERASKTGAQGDTLKQGATINQSLTTLSRVIAALAKQAGASDSKKKKKAVGIPYRESKLTRFLQTSLGGNARTGLSIHMSPHADNLEETISTLDFGSRAKEIKNKASANVQKSTAQLEKELAALQKAHDSLKAKFKELSGGKLPEGLADAEGGDDGGDGGGGGGGGASAVELEEEREKVKDLEETLTDRKQENENLMQEIESLNAQVVSQGETLEGIKKDYQIKELEVQTLDTKLKNAQAGASGAVDAAEQKSMQSKEIQELNQLVEQQRDMLNRERDENRELKQENIELSDELTEKTRRLALAELQVMRYENARARVKDNKIKVKITSKKAKQSSNAWSTLLDTAPNTSRTKDADYEQLRKGTILEKFGTLHPIPDDQLKGGRKGFLQERLYKKTEFIKRYFVAEDSYLMCYENDGSAMSVPRYAIPLSESKIGSCPKQGNYEHCFMVLCGQYFNVLATNTEAEKAVWLRDLNFCKFVTHENLLNLAYFNQRAVQTIEDVNKQDRVKARVMGNPYSKMGEKEYAEDVPVKGGAEGVVYTNGVNSPDDADVAKEWKPYYCIVKDSYFLLYDTLSHSELVTEPRAIMHLGAGSVDVIKGPVEEEEDVDASASSGLDEETARKNLPPGSKLNKYFFTVQGPDASVNMYVLTEEKRANWIIKLQMGALVTIKNVMLAAIDKESISAEAGINPTGRDLLGNLLDPGALQPFDERLKPLYRHPDGRTLNRDMVPHDMKAARISVDKTPLDFYNRPLPSGAVAMFSASPVEPVGVGVDGKHYAYPSGRVLKMSDKHYDAAGRALSADVIKAADAIQPALRLATIVRSSILTKEKLPIYDAFGRLLRRERDGSLLTLDGQRLPATAAVFDVVGNPATVPPAGKGEVATLKIEAYGKDGIKRLIGEIGVESGYTTLQDLHQSMKKNIDQIGSGGGGSGSKITSIHFLYKGTIIPDQGKSNWLCSDFMPTITCVCRDMGGNLMVVDGDVLKMQVDHEAADQETARDRESEFVKMVSMLKRKRASIAMGHASNVTPRSGSSAPASARAW